MATADRILQLKLIADTASLNRDMTKAQQGVTRMGASFKKMGAVIGGAIGAFAAVDFAKGAIEAASAVDELNSKLGVLLGSSADLVQNFAKTASKLGLSRKSALSAASKFAQLFRTVGVGRKESARFSVQFTKLAADMASFSDTTPEEALEALGAGLRGESEPLRKYGVLLDDASLRSTALSAGIIKVSRALTPQEKLLAARLLILKQTASQEGDVGRTSGSLANTQRRLAAKFEDVKLAIGQFLLPGFTSIVSFITDELMPALSSGNIAGAIGKIVEGIGRVVPVIARAIEDLLFGTEKFVGIAGEGGAVKKVRFGGLIDAFKEAGPAIIDAILEGLVELGGRIQTAWDEQIATVDWAKAIPDVLATFWRDTLQPFLTQVADKGPIAAAALGFIATALLGLALPAFLASLPIIAIGLAVAGAAAAFVLLMDKLPEIQRFFQDVQTAIQGFLDDVSRAFETGMAEVRNFIDPIQQEVQHLLDLLSQLDPFKDEITTIERIRARPGQHSGGGFASGGIVRRPTIAMVGEAGPEAIVPLTGRSGMGWGGITINVYAGVGNPVEIGRQVDRVLRAYRGRAGIAA
jgi:hypothetical protein